MEVDNDTMEPKSELSSAAVDWCKENGIKGKTIEEILNGSDFARFVLGGKSYTADLLM